MKFDLFFNFNFMTYLVYVGSTSVKHDNHKAPYKTVKFHLNSDLYNETFPTSLELRDTTESKVATTPTDNIITKRNSQSNINKFFEQGAYPEAKSNTKHNEFSSCVFKDDLNVGIPCDIKVSTQTYHLLGRSCFIKQKFDFFRNFYP